ncbi:MAG: hypothetical protein ACI391_01410 [Muribaculaceae bacterium]
MGAPHTPQSRFTSYRGTAGLSMRERVPRVSLADGVIRGRAVLTRLDAVPTDGALRGCHPGMPQQAAALQVADCLCSC